MQTLTNKPAKILGVKPKVGIARMHMPGKANVSSQARVRVGTLGISDTTSNTDKPVKGTKRWR